MIQCDKCQKWLHTPCAGFPSNNDKRIPEKYLCQNCEYGANKKLLKHLQDLASFRRAISVVYHEGLASIAWFSKRLDCGAAKASKLIRRLETEGLVSKPNSQTRVFSYTVHKTPEAKKKVYYYFGQDLTAFPELAGYFKPKPQPTAASKEISPIVEPPKSPGVKRLFPESKRRKSMTEKPISCM